MFIVLGAHSVIYKKDDLWGKGEWGKCSHANLRPLQTWGSSSRLSLDTGCRTSVFRQPSTLTRLRVHKQAFCETLHFVAPEVSLEIKTLHGCPSALLNTPSLSVVFTTNSAILPVAFWGPEKNKVQSPVRAVTHLCPISAMGTGDWCSLGHASLG